MKKLAVILFFLTIVLNGKSQTVIGDIAATQIKFFEYYNHTNEHEWLKLFHINDNEWSRGGISGTVMFQDYHGKGGGLIHFTFPQSINPDQKPTIVLHGNAANVFNWYAYRSVDNKGYDVYIKTPGYHVGFAFMVRGYSYVEHFEAIEAPSGEEIWNTGIDTDTHVCYSGNGNIGFGTRNPEYKLDVIGTIRAQELKVDMQGADFVFEENYQLRSLEEVENFVQENRHLPEVAPAKEMQENGVNQSEMNQKLLQKIEELTLYMIEQNKLNKIQTQELKVLKEENLELKKLINHD
jgi:hypothetical protein